MGTLLKVRSGSVFKMDPVAQMNPDPYDLDTDGFVSASVTDEKDPSLLDRSLRVVKLNLHNVRVPDRKHFKYFRMNLSVGTCTVPY